MNDTELDEMLGSWQAPPVPPSLRASLRARFPQPQSHHRLRWLLAFAAAATLIALPIALIDDAIPMGDSLHWDDHTQVMRIRTLHPASLQEQWQPGLSTGAVWKDGALTGSVYMLNPKTREHAGYTWRAQPREGKYLFTALPLDPQVLREPGPIAAVSPLPLPRVISPGMAFDVDLYRSGDARIYDHYEVTSKFLEIPTPPPSPADPPVLTLTTPKLFRNGQLIPGNSGVVKASSPILTVGAPGRGYFLLSVDGSVDPRFERDGAIKGNVLEFQFGNDQWRVECTAPIAADAPLYVFFQPNPALDSVLFAAGSFIPLHR